MERCRWKVSPRYECGCDESIRGVVIDQHVTVENNEDACLMFESAKSTTTKWIRTLVGTRGRFLLRRGSGYCGLHHWRDSESGDEERKKRWRRFEDKEERLDIWSMGKDGPGNMYYRAGCGKIRGVQSWITAMNKWKLARSPG
jgi:hypothetical protein